MGDPSRADEKSVVVHAGSGRELAAVLVFCQATHSPLIELSTGSQIATQPLGFPVVVCPNTNVLMLKFMRMLAASGQLFSGYPITLTESHQAQKSSVPGTAVSMAHALGLEARDIHSVRDPLAQAETLRIPIGHLDRQSYHQIVVEDAPCRITLEARVLGAAPYAQGVGQIVRAVLLHGLENRLYDIDEFVANAWI